MPTRAENLETVLDNLAQQLADISANPKPSYSVGGQSVSWTEYFRMLTEQMKAVREQIQQEGAPFQVVHQGRV